MPRGKFNKNQLWLFGPDSQKEQVANEQDLAELVTTPSEEVRRDLEPHEAVIIEAPESGSMQVVVERITPLENCQMCHGQGYVRGDIVDYGSAKTHLPDNYCDCVLEQVQDINNAQIEVIAPGKGDDDPLSYDEDSDISGDNKLRESEEYPQEQELTGAETRIVLSTHTKGTGYLPLAHNSERSDLVDRSVFDGATNANMTSSEPSRVEHFEPVDEKITAIHPSIDKEVEQKEPVEDESTSVPGVGVSPRSKSSAISAPYIAPSDIPLDLARRAHSGTSWVPEERATGEEKGYVQHMESVWANLQKCANTEESRVTATAEFNRYRREWLARYTTLLSSRAGLVSTYIAGPSNFPARRMNKKNDAYDKKLHEFLEWDKRAQNAMRQVVDPCAPRSISADREDAVEALQKKIDEAERLQVLMKKANAIIRQKDLTDEQKIAKMVELGLKESTARTGLEPDYMGRKGIPNYALTNNNANIRRMMARIEEITANRARKPGSATFEGGRIEENETENRIQIFFNRKPPQELREKLKSNGFHWAPSQGAWQRQRNDNARQAVERLFNVRLTSEADVSQEDVGGAVVFIPIENQEESKPFDGQIDQSYEMAQLDGEVESSKEEERGMKNVVSQINDIEPDRLFIGGVPTGIAYWDRAREEDGDYQIVAILFFDTLELQIYDDKSPLLPKIEGHAKKIQAKRGEWYSTSGSGLQGVTLGYSTLGKATIHELPGRETPVVRSSSEDEITKPDRGPEQESGLKSGEIEIRPAPALIILERLGLFRKLKNGCQYKDDVGAERWVTAHTENEAIQHAVTTYRKLPDALIETLLNLAAEGIQVRTNRRMEPGANLNSIVHTSVVEWSDRRLSADAKRRAYRDAIIFGEIDTVSYEEFAESIGPQSDWYEDGLRYRSTRLQPWEVSPDQFVRARVRRDEIHSEVLIGELYLSHYTQVKEAIEEGIDISARALANYPELRLLISVNESTSKTASEVINVPDKLRAITIDASVLNEEADQIRAVRPARNPLGEDGSRVEIQTAAETAEISPPESITPPLSEPSLSADNHEKLMIKEEVPGILAPLRDQIPDILKDLDRWVCWRGKWSPNKKKYDKPPFTPQGYGASTTNPKTWSSFSVVMKAYEEGILHFHGVGFVLDVEGDDSITNLVAVDFDHCLALDDRGEYQITDPKVTSWVELLDTYTEISPSGEGLRLFLKGFLPPGGRKSGHVEVYDSGRYVTVTGRSFHANPRLIQHRQSQVEQFHTEAFPQDVRLHGTRPIEFELSQTDAELLEIAFRAKNGDSIKRLYDGDMSEYKDPVTGRPDHSVADLAYCSKMAFYSGGSPERLDRFFRASKLYRPEKWDKVHFSSGETYGERVIEMALVSCRKFYGQKREAWQMTRDEFRSQENGVKVEAIHNALRRGQTLYLRTYKRATRLTDPDQIRLTSGGDVQTCAGKKWLYLVDYQVEDLARQAGMEFPAFMERVTHGEHVEEALRAGKPVPTNVLADYPEIVKGMSDHPDHQPQRSEVQGIENLTEIEGQNKPTEIEDVEAMALVESDRQGAKSDERDVAVLIKSTTHQPEGAFYKRGDKVKWLSGQMRLQGIVQGYDHGGNILIREESGEIFTVPEVEINHRDDLGVQEREEANPKTETQQIKEEITDSLHRQAAGTVESAHILRQSDGVMSEVIAGVRTKDEGVGLSKNESQSYSEIDKAVEQRGAAQTRTDVSELEHKDVDILPPASGADRVTEIKFTTGTYAEIHDASPDRIFAICQRDTYFTLWMKVRGNDLKKYSRWQYLSILPRTEDEAIKAAEEAMRDIASGKGRSRAFSGDTAVDTIGKSYGLITDQMTPHELVPPESQEIGNELLRFGKYPNALVKDLFEKDANYALWAADKLSGSKRAREIGEYLRSRPEYLEAKIGAIEAAQSILTPESLNLLREFGIEATIEHNIITFGGNTYDWKEFIKGAGGYFRDGIWRLKLAQARDVIDRLRGIPSIARGQRGGLPDYIKNPKLAELRRDLDSRPDRSGLDRAIGEYVGEDTRALLKRGIAAGIPAGVIDEQIEDVAMIKQAYERNEGLFLLASEPGSGKTFVLGAAIRELRNAGANRIIYVTLREELISQIGKDLENYGIGDVVFITYPMMRKAIATESDVVIFDEGHSNRNIAAGEEGSKQAHAARQWVAKTKMTIISSATPFENPVQAAYLEPTGIFEPAGGFENFALAFGANKQVVGDEEVLLWRRNPLSDVDAMAARNYFVKAGVFTSRPTRLPENMVDVRMVNLMVNEEVAKMYDALSEAAIKHECNLGGFGSAWIVNLQKRILEAAKVERGVQEARSALERERYPIIFVETKAERNIDIPDLVRREYEWSRAVAAAMASHDITPKRKDFELPPQGVVDVLADFMGSTGQKQILIRSAEDVIQEALGHNNVALFTGSITNKRAQKNLDAWRRGDKKVLVATMAKGGTGLSLHDKIGDHPNTQVGINLPWTATQLKQVMQRPARYGLQSEVELMWLFADNIPFDRELAARVGGRMADMGASVYGIEIKEAKKLMEFDFESKSFSEIRQELEGHLGSGVKGEGAESAHKAGVGGLDLSSVRLEIRKYHSKYGNVRYIVTLSKRIGNTQFAEYCKLAKEMGGLYSKAYRGVTFNDEAAAERFVAKQLRDLSHDKSVQQLETTELARGEQTIRSLAESQEELKSAAAGETSNQIQAEQWTSLEAVKETGQSAVATQIKSEITEVPSAIADQGRRANSKAADNKYSSQPGGEEKAPWEMTAREWEEAPKTDRDVFYVKVGAKSVPVYKNPTSSEHTEISKRFREKFPNAPSGEPKSRFTIDEYGNRYVWMAADAVHVQIELDIAIIAGTEVSQSMDHYYVIENALKAGKSITGENAFHYRRLVEKYATMQGDIVNSATTAVPLELLLGEASATSQTPSDNSPLMTTDQSPVIGPTDVTLPKSNTRDLVNDQLDFLVEQNALDIILADRNKSPIRAMELAAARVRNFVGAELSRVAFLVREGTATEGDIEWHDKTSDQLRSIWENLIDLTGTRTILLDLDEPEAKQPLIQQFMPPEPESVAYEHFRQASEFFLGLKESNRQISLSDDVKEHTSSGILDDRGEELSGKSTQFNITGESRSEDRRQIIEFQNGPRYARVVQTPEGLWEVYVGIRTGDSCPGEEILPAPWFKGYRDCCATYKREAKAIKEAERFVNRPYDLKQSEVQITPEDGKRFEENQSILESEPDPRLVRALIDGFKKQEPSVEVDQGWGAENNDIILIVKCDSEYPLNRLASKLGLLIGVSVSNTESSLAKVFVFNRVLVEETYRQHEGKSIADDNRRTTSDQSDEKMSGAQQAESDIFSSPWGPQTANDIFDERFDRLFGKREPGAQTVNDAAVKVVREITEGVDESLMGLAKLFGGSRLSAGFTFDEETYRQAEPHFKKAYQHFKEAAKDFGDAVELLLKTLNERYGMSPESLGRMKPYIIQFVTTIAKPTRLQIVMAEVRERKLQQQAAVDRFIKDYGERPFQAPIEGSDKLYVIAHRSTKPGTKGEWQFTLFDELGPVGDLTTSDYRLGLLAQVQDLHVDLSKADVQTEIHTVEPSTVNSNFKYSTPTEDVAALEEVHLVGAEDTRLEDFSHAYFYYDGSKVESPRETHIKDYPYRLGTWRIDQHVGPYGREVERLEMLDPELLQIADGHFRSRIDEGTYKEILCERLREGKLPPPILVVQTDQGEFLVSKGEQLVAAAKIVGVKIPVWVSYAMSTGNTDINGEPILTALTYEGAKYGPIEAHRIWEDRQQDLNKGIREAGANIQQTERNENKDKGYDRAEVIDLIRSMPTVNAYPMQTEGIQQSEGKDCPSNNDQIMGGEQFARADTETAALAKDTITDYENTVEAYKRVTPRRGTPERHEFNATQDERCMIMADLEDTLEQVQDPLRRLAILGNIADKQGNREAYIQTYKEIKETLFKKAIEAGLSEEEAKSAANQAGNLLITAPMEDRLADYRGVFESHVQMSKEIAAAREQRISAVKELAEMSYLREDQRNEAEREIQRTGDLIKTMNDWRRLHEKQAPKEMGTPPDKSTIETILKVSISIKQVLRHAAEYDVDLYRAVYHARGGSVIARIERLQQLGWLDSSKLMTERGRQAVQFVREAEYGFTIESYVPGPGKLPQPTGGWYINTLSDGREAYSDGKILLVGKPPGKNPEISDLDKNFNRVINPQEAKFSPTPAMPFGYAIRSNEPRIVVFDGGQIINADYYDYIINEYPNSTFHPQEGKQKPLYIYNRKKLVGAVMPMYIDIPSALEPLLEAHWDSLRLSFETVPTAVSQEVEADYPNPVIIEQTSGGRESQANVEHDPSKIEVPATITTTESSQQGQIESSEDEGSTFNIIEERQEQEPSRYAGKSRPEIENIRELYQAVIDTKEANRDKVPEVWRERLQELETLLGSGQPEYHIITDSKYYGHPENYETLPCDYGLVPTKINWKTDLTWRIDKAAKLREEKQTELGRILMPPQQSKKVRRQSTANQKELEDRIKSISDTEQYLYQLQERQKQLHHTHRPQDLEETSKLDTLPVEQHMTDAGAESSPVPPLTGLDRRQTQLENKKKIEVWHMTLGQYVIERQKTAERLDISYERLAQIYPAEKLAEEHRRAVAEAAGRGEVIQPEVLDSLPSEMVEKLRSRFGDSAVPKDYESQFDREQKAKTGALDKKIEEARNLEADKQKAQADRQQSQDERRDMSRMFDETLGIYRNARLRLNEVQGELPGSQRFEALIPGAKQALDTARRNIIRTLEDVVPAWQQQAARDYVNEFAPEALEQESGHDKQQLDTVTDHGDDDAVSNTAEQKISVVQPSQATSMGVAASAAFMNDGVADGMNKTSTEQQKDERPGSIEIIWQDYRRETPGLDSLEQSDIMNRESALSSEVGNLGREIQSKSGARKRSKWGGQRYRELFDEQGRLETRQKIAKRELHEVRELKDLIEAEDRLGSAKNDGEKLIALAWIAQIKNDDVLKKRVEEELPGYLMSRVHDVAGDNSINADLFTRTDANELTKKIVDSPRYADADSTLFGALRQKQTQAKFQEARLEALNYIDHLTGLSMEEQTALRRQINDATYSQGIEMAMKSAQRRSDEHLTNAGLYKKIADAATVPSEKDVLASIGKQKTDPETGLTALQASYLIETVKSKLPDLATYSRSTINVPGGGQFKLGSVEQANNFSIRLTGRPLIPELQTEIKKSKALTPEGRETVEVLRYKPNLRRMPLPKDIEFETISDEEYASMQTGRQKVDAGSTTASDKIADISPSGSHSNVMEPDKLGGDGDCVFSIIKGQKDRPTERFIVELHDQYPWAIPAGVMSDHARVGKNIRMELKRQFPGVKFSVKSDENAIHVGWKLGPTANEVEVLTRKYQDTTYDSYQDRHIYDDSAYGNAVKAVLGRHTYVSCSRDYPKTVKEEVQHGLCRLQNVDYSGPSSVALSPSNPNRDDVATQAYRVLARTRFPTDYDGNLSVILHPDGDIRSEAWAKIAFSSEAERSEDVGENLAPTTPTHIEHMSPWLLTEPKPQELQTGAGLSQQPNIPDIVKWRVTNALNCLRSINQEIERGRRMDKQFGGEGRYESDIYEGLQSSISRAMEVIAIFRKHAPSINVDAEAFLESVGGVPEITLSDEGQDWYYYQTEKKKKWEAKQLSKQDIIVEPVKSDQANENDMHSVTTGSEEEQKLSLKESVKNVVTETVQGLDDAVKGLSKLFVGDEETKLSMGLSFDEYTYRQAKPYFEQAFAHFGEASQSMHDMMQAFVANLREHFAFAVETLEKMRPYLERFIDEITTVFERVDTNILGRVQSKTSPASPLGDRTLEQSFPFIAGACKMGADVKDSAAFVNGSDMSIFTFWNVNGAFIIDGAGSVHVTQAKFTDVLNAIDGAPAAQPGIKDLKLTFGDIHLASGDIEVSIPAKTKIEVDIADFAIDPRHITDTSHQRYIYDRSLSV